MPDETRTRVITRFRGLVPLASSSIRVERIVPNMGVVKLNIDTFDTGLCWSRTPHSA